MQASPVRGIWSIPRPSDATASAGVDYWHLLMKKLQNPLLVFALTFLGGGMMLSLALIATAL